MLLRVLAFAIFLGASSAARAQEAFSMELPELQPADSSAPQSAWLDLRQTTPAMAKTQSAPPWVESVSLVPAQTAEGTTAQTIFRIRLARPRADFQALYFRLFFDDKPDQRPTLVAWDESGTQVLRSAPLGSGVDLPISDIVMVPTVGVSAVDVEVPGDGSTIRGAYLDWMTSSEVLHPLTAEQRDLVAQPFASISPLHAPAQDSEMFGTVTASLSDETIKIGPSVAQGAAFQFSIEEQPLVALLTFEVASPRIDAPPEIYVNGESIGTVTLTLPELADPAYRGEMEPLVRQMKFQYTGWLRAQKLVPAASLKTGANDLIVVGGANTPASAIRATQIQLKYLWDKSDYLLTPQPPQR
jgi:hypothetical protein